MQSFKEKFTIFFLTVLKFLMIILIPASFGAIFFAHIFLSAENLIRSIIIVTLIMIGIILIEFYIIRKNFSYKKQIYLILFCGFIIRALWLLNINSFPTSDYMIIYESAQDFLNGSTSMFWGSSYIARFPHLTIMVFYMALMIKIFPANNILMIKLVNLALGVLTIYIIYLIVKEIFNSNKKGIYAASLATIFPPLVTYTGVFCTENIAIPLYLLSVYIFILVLRGKKNKYYLILSGLMLSLGNLFRMVATIMIVAYAIYIIIYSKDKIVHKIRNIALYSIPYFMLLFLVSFTLQSLKITEFPLWEGSEPKITNVLKGTNIESIGRWNEEDASIPEKYNYDYEEIKEASVEIIKERLTTTPPLKLISFYVKKFAMQWGIGDFEGTHWTKSFVPQEDIVLDVSLEVSQTIYSIMMILVFLGILNRKNNKENEEINLFYIMLCGYGVMYLVTEAQGRYSYIISWVFIILAVEGINFILNKFDIDIKKGFSKRDISKYERNL
ncbi:glycosyltransferase family 39 protein [Clostridium sp. MB05]|uniref:glycosyltransferase family 39 protein n=1 Tax=Clostridium sp. MB05 TaxID=3376682 RepID=UPI0039819724